MNHSYPRIERDLRALAVNFSAGNVRACALPERLECLAAYVRTVLEAEKAANGEPNAFDARSVDYNVAIDRMRAAGVGYGEGEFALSPCMGADQP